MTSISVVFPLFTEEDYVLRAYEAAVDALRQITNDYQIIRVNDASTDRTSEIIDSL